MYQHCCKTGWPRDKGVRKDIVTHFKVKKEKKTTTTKRLNDFIINPFATILLEIGDSHAQMMRCIIRRGKLQQEKNTTAQNKMLDLDIDYKPSRTKRVNSTQGHINGA